MEQYLEFATTHPVVMAGLVGSFLLLVFSELRRKSTDLVAVDASAAVKLINNDALVIDLRSADAHGRGHIVNAKSVPFDELPAKLDGLVQYKDRPLLAVCDAGVTSTRAVKQLREAGFESAYGLKGGMAAWTQDGLPVVTGKKTRGGQKPPKAKKKRKQDSAS
jgi:rhodanese-related sulfurtransferase